MTAAAALLVSSTAACGAGGEESSDSVTFAGFGGSTQEAQSAAYIEPYAKSSGVDIKEDSPVDYAKLKTMVQSGNVSWDVMDVDPFFAIANCGTLLQPIDTKIVDLSQVPGDLTLKCGVPEYLSADMIFYNADKFKSDPPTSFADFFDTKKYPGKRAITKDAAYGPLETALLGDGVARDQVYPIDYDRAFKKLDTIKNDLVFWDTGAEQQQMMQNGSVSMVLGWPGRAYNADKAGGNFKPMWDATLWIYNVFAVAKGSPHTEAAMKFINYAISEKPQRRFADLSPYSPVNVNVGEPSDPLLKEFSPSLQKREKFDLFLTNEKWWADNLDTAVEKYTAWQTG